MPLDGVRGPEGGSFTLKSSRSTSLSALPERTSGLILPVWVALAAVAAVRQLLGQPAESELELDLLPPCGRCLLPLEAVAPLADGRAMAISRCDPGPGLDLTRELAVWVLARWGDGICGADAPCFQLRAGHGVGRNSSSAEICLSAYARQLLQINLAPLVPPGQMVSLEVVIPEGRERALRTSNAAFGVVDGLALIGTQAEVQRSAAPDQLQQALDALRSRAQQPGGCAELVLVVGENGLDLAPRLGLPAQLLLKSGNWIGPLLAAAAELGVQRLLLFGYHGKLIKLAGGIFHTHHHLADGRAEVLTAFAALEGLQGPALEALHRSATVEAALDQLQRTDPELEQRLRGRITAAIEARAAASIQATTGVNLKPGVALFDRSRCLWAVGAQGRSWFGSASL